MNGIHAAWRPALTGVIALVSLGALPLARDYPVIVAALTYAAILATGRSTLPWLGMTMTGRLVRRGLRVAIFFAPLPFLAEVSLAWRPVESLLAAAAAIALLAPDYRNIVRELRADRLVSRPYRSSDEPVRDLISYAGSGVAQEYFYRGVTLLSLFPYLGWAAILPVGMMFIVEHVMQGRGGPVFDRRDLVVQAVMSIVFGALVISSGSVLPAMIGHTLYNLPNVVQIPFRLSAHRAYRRRSRHEVQS